MHKGASTKGPATCDATGAVVAVPQKVVFKWETTEKHRSLWTGASSLIALSQQWKENITDLAGITWAPKAVKHCFSPVEAA